MDVETKSKEIQFVVGKHGYVMEMFPKFSTENILHAPIHLFMSKSSTSLFSQIFHIGETMVKSVVILGIEFFLLLSLALEYLYARLYGIEQTFLFIVPTVFCLFLLLFVHDLQVRKTVDRT